MWRWWRVQDPAQSSVIVHIIIVVVVVVIINITLVLMMLVMTMGILTQQEPLDRFERGIHNNTGRTTGRTTGSTMDTGTGTIIIIHNVIIIIHNVIHCVVMIGG